jgi:hypothetical protein
MNLKKYQPILEVISISFFGYLVHKLFFYLKESNPNYANFYYPIELIYGFFFLCSVIIILILIKVKSKNLDNVGYTFLLTTFIKMGFAYAVLNPVLQSGNSNIKFEKINFLIVFVLFLAIETFVTIRILNNED